ncbi:MAG TPA: ThuA domain-containing protein [Gemmatimonadales bacterium]|nr:ThuA domain-containing protein [Gemmatimonadales bacterium]
MRRAWIVAAALAAVLGCHSSDGADQDVCPATSATTLTLPAHTPFQMLVFYRTTGYHHSSITSGIAAVHQLGADNTFTIEATDDPIVFTDGNLARFAVVMFLSTTGDVLDTAQQSAFERYIRAGHGFVGVHSASDTEYDWPWYHALLGATFMSHPALQQGTVIVVDATQASTQTLPSPWVRSDEWYNFTGQPSGVTVLARVDESTYSGGNMGATHPIAWQHEYDGGRAWYTAMGHPACSYSEGPFLNHLLGGIGWAARIY